MNETPPSLPTSPEELAAEAQFYYNTSPEDPKSSDIKRLLDSERARTAAWITADKLLWTELFNEYPKNAFARKEFEKEGILYVVTLTVYKEKVEAMVDIASLPWARAKKAELNNLFNEDSLDPGLLKDGFPLEILAKRMKLQPQNDFVVTKPSFSVKGMIDGLGRGLDENIKDLILYLNMLGFETTMSCGGHEGDAYQPYLRFKAGSDMSKVLSLFLAWQQEGGKTSVVRPFGRYAEKVELSYSSSLPLVEAQKDLKDFTEFLAKKIGKFPRRRAFPLEFANSFGGKISKFLKGQN